MHVFMVMENDGDYEVRYANPNLKTSAGKSRKSACVIRLYQRGAAALEVMFSLAEFQQAFPGLPEGPANVNTGSAHLTKSLKCSRI